MRPAVLLACLSAGCFPSLELQDCYTLGDCPPEVGECRVGAGPVRLAAAVEPAPPALAWDGERFVVLWSEGLDLRSQRVAPDGSLDQPGDAEVIDSWEGFVDAPRPALVGVGGRLHAAWQRSGGAEVVWGPLGEAPTTLADGAGLGGPPLADAAGRPATAWWDLDGQGRLVVDLDRDLEFDPAPGLWGDPSLVGGPDHTLLLAMARPGEVTNDLGVWRIGLDPEDPNRVTPASPTDHVTPGDVFRPALADRQDRYAVAFEDAGDVRLVLEPDGLREGTLNAAGVLATTPALSWSPRLRAYAAAWAEGPDSEQRIHASVLDEAGAPLGRTLTVSPEGNALRPKLAWAAAANVWGLAWYEWNGPDAGVHFATVRCDQP